MVNFEYIWHNIFPLLNLNKLILDGIFQENFKICYPRKIWKNRMPGHLKGSQEHAIFSTETIGLHLNQNNTLV